MGGFLFVGLIILSLFAGEYYDNDLFTNSAVIMLSFYVFLVFVMFGCWIFFDVVSRLDRLGVVSRDKLLIIASEGSNFMTIGLVFTLVMCGMLFAAVMVVVCAFMMFWIQDDVRGYLNNGENHE